MPQNSRSVVPPKLPEDDDSRLAELARALAHPARLNIIRLLRRRRRCIGCDIVEEIGLAQSTTSEHLRILKAAGLIVGEIERPRVCYSLNPTALRPLRAFLDLVNTEPGDDEMDDVFNVLILCTGNSARSLIAEALINFHGRGHFRGYSAGSQPRGEPHPLAVEILRRHNLPTDNLRSKSWDEFAEPGAPNLDFVFTVCDNAANEVCPVWPGQPMTAHWGMPDPAAVEGPEYERVQAFRDAFRVLDNRIKIFTSLPLRSLDRMKLQKRLDDIGKSHPETPAVNS